MILFSSLNVSRSYSGHTLWAFGTPTIGKMCMHNNKMLTVTDDTKYTTSILHVDTIWCVMTALQKPQIFVVYVMQSFCEIQDVRWMMVNIAH